MALAAVDTEETSEVSVEEPKNLYAQSAALIDADSGRVLFVKNGDKQLPMASTTKIMTCITALEKGDLEDTVTVSKTASRMPDVQLNAREGEQFKLKDLLYSLMLESHNDAAYAIAEHIGGSAEGFAALMNEKAKELGCNNTYFITPNGLDATDSIGTHSTTAVDLAAIMRYCINVSPKKEEFLEITRTSAYSFTDLSGSYNYSCNNHNAFLNMMEGALSGKTGFTGNAGYCYVGALEREGKTFIVALLACGWPNNKSYKWNDTRKLMDYGLENYEPYNFNQVEMDENYLSPLVVEQGQTKEIGGVSTVGVEIEKSKDNKENAQGLLLRKDESVKVVYNMKNELEAPVKEGDPVGTIQYIVGGKIWRTEVAIADKDVNKIDFTWCFKQVLGLFLMEQ